MRKWIVLAVVLSFFCGLQVASASFGTNWQADYYNSTDLSGPVVFSETFPNGMDINWGNGSPDPSVNTDNFSARFTSTQTFDAGDYSFVASSDDGMRVFIDNVLVLDKFIGRTLTTDIFAQTMTAGPHTFRVEYAEFINQASVQFQWFRVGDAEPGLPPGIYDGRANYGDLAAPAAIYCHSYGIDIYAIDAEGKGTLVFTVTPEQLQAVAGDSEGKLIASADEIGGSLEVWHTADGNLLLRAHEPNTGKVYDFVWSGCT